MCVKLIFDLFFNFKNCYFLRHIVAFMQGPKRKFCRILQLGGFQELESAKEIPNVQKRDPLKDYLFRVESPLDTFYQWSHSVYIFIS